MPTYQTWSDKLQLQGFKALVTHTDQEDDEAHRADGQAQVEDNRAVGSILGLNIKLKIKKRQGLQTFRNKAIFTFRFHSLFDSICSCLCCSFLNC